MNNIDEDIRFKDFIMELVKNNETTIYNKIGKKGENANIFKYMFTYDQILTSLLNYNPFRDNREVKSKIYKIYKMLEEEVGYKFEDQGKWSQQIYFTFHPKKAELFKYEMERVKEVLEIFKKYEDVSKPLLYILWMNPHKKELDSSYKEIYEYSLNQLINKDDIKEKLNPYMNGKGIYPWPYLYWHDLKKEVNFLSLSKKNIELIKVELNFFKKFMKVFEEVIEKNYPEKYTKKEIYKDMFTEMKFAKFHKDMEKALAKGEYSEEQISELREIIDNIFPNVEQKNKKNAEILMTTELEVEENNNSMFFLETLYNTGYLGLNIFSENSTGSDNNIVSLETTENGQKVKKDYLTLRESVVHKNLTRIEVMFLQDFSWKEKTQITKFVSELLSDFIVKDGFDYRWGTDASNEFKSKSQEVIREILLIRDIEQTNISKNNLKKNKI